MSYAWHLSPKAAAAVEETYFYGLVTWDLHQTAMYQRGLESSFDLIAAFPYGGKSVDEFMQGLRQYRYQKHYIFYTISEEEQIVDISTSATLALM